MASKRGKHHQITHHEGLPDGRAVQRQKVVKLELGNDTHSRLALVSEKILNIGPPPTRKASDNINWKTVDDDLFKRAKQSYDEVLKPFEKEPRVYYFESVKEAIWADKDAEILRAIEEKKRKEEEERAKRDEIFAGRTGIKKPKMVNSELMKAIAKDAKEDTAKGISKSRPNSRQVKLGPSNETLVETFIDPFSLPKGWRIDKNPKTGEIWYVNEETLDRFDKQPAEAEVWIDKLDLLQRLTPRHDMNGYEFKEDVKQKRVRLRKVQDFDKRLKEEAIRRETKPTDLEQVEDALFYIVDTIDRRDRELKEAIKAAKRQNLIKSWHTATLDYKMKHLPITETESGEKIVIVSDLDVIDMIITPTGFVLSKMTPPGLFEKFAKEREDKRKEDERLLAEIEEDRLRPFKESLSTAMYFMRNKDVKQGGRIVAKAIKDKTLHIPRKLAKLERAAVIAKSKALVLQGIKSFIKAAKNPKATVNEIYDDLYQRVFPKDEKQLELERLIQSFEAGQNLQEEVKVEEETEEERLRRLAAMKPQPITHPDCVLVTLTMLVDPPPHYVLKPAPTILTKAKERIEVASENLKMLNVLPILPNIVTDTLGVHDRDIHRAKLKWQESKLKKFRKLNSLKEDIDDSKANAVNVETNDEDNNEDDKDMIVATTAAVEDNVENQEENGVEQGSGNTDLDLKQEEPSNSNRITHVMDRSIREEWEKIFIREIAHAVSIDPSNIHIEEIRRLEKNCHKLRQLKRHQLKLDEKADREREQQAKLQEEEQLRRKMISIGKSHHLISGDGSNCPNTAQEPERPSIESEVIEVAQGSPQRKEDVNDRKENDDNDKLATKKVNFQAGLRNPDDTKNDPKYWLAKGLSIKSPEEKRQDRIALLKKLQITEKGIKAQLTKMKTMRDMLKEDFVEQMGTIKHVYVKQAAEHLEPFVEEFKERMIPILNNISEKLKGKKAILESKAHSLISIKEEVNGDLMSRTGEVIEDNIIDTPVPSSTRTLHPLELQRREKLHEERMLQHDEDIVTLIDSLCNELESSLCEGNDHDGIDYSNYFMWNDLLLPGSQVENEIVEVSPVAPVYIQDDAQNDIPVSVNEEIENIPTDIAADIAADLDNSAGESPIRRTFLREDEDIEMKMVDLLRQLSDLQPLNDEDEERYEINRQQRLEEYPEDIVFLLDAMCLSVEVDAVRMKIEEQQRRHAEFIEKQNDDNSYDDNADDLGDLVGCEISIMIRVSDGIRAIEGLEEAEAEDFAIFLQQQVHDSHSLLRLGAISGGVLDAKYNTSSKNRVFNQWESFWVHSISPVFFGYKSRKNPSIQVDDDEFHKLPPGMNYLNPYDEFSDSNWETYKQLGRPSKGALEANSEKALLTHWKLKEILDDDNPANRELKVLRPNMENIDAYTLHTLKRASEGFEMRYKREMNRGLVNGGLRPEQYAALKDKETSLRIYKIARQKFNRKNSHLFEEEKVPLVVTKVTDAVMDEWKEEARLEQEEKMRDEKVRKAHKKEQHKVDAEIRKRYNQQKGWCLIHLISAHPNTAEVGPRMRLAIEEDAQLEEKLRTNQLPKHAVDEINQEKLAFKNKIVEEEKRSRKFFEVVVKWAWRRKIAHVNERIRQHKVQIQNADSAILNNADDDEVAKNVDEHLVEDNIDLDNARVYKTELVTFFDVLKQTIALEKYKYECDVILEAVEEKKRLRALSAERRQQLEDMRREQIEKGLPQKRERSFEVITQEELDKEVGIVETAEVLQNEELAIFPPSPPLVAAGYEILPYDFELVKQVGWIQSLLHSDEVLSAILHYPTVDEGIYLRNEFVQFGQVMCELYPNFSRVSRLLLKEKEEKDIASGLVRVGKKRDESDEERLKREEQEAMTEEIERRKKRNEENLAKQEEKAKAWIMAHPHKFVELPGERPFCVLCRMRTFDNWLNNLNSANTAWKDLFEDQLLSKIEKNRDFIFRQVEDEHIVSYEEKIGKKIPKKIDIHVISCVLDLIVNVEKRVDGQVSPVPEGYLLNMEPLRVKPMVFPPRLPKNVTAPRLVPTSITMSGLSYYDPDGHCILPASEDIPLTEQVVDDEEEQVEIEDDDYEEGENPPLGLKFKLWHKDLETGKKGDFLGQFTLGYNDVIAPPKGIRAYKLVPDNTILDTEDKEIVGTLAVKVTAKRIDKETNKPRNWRLQIVRASRIAAVSRKTLSTPYVEVMWRGPGIKNGKDIQINHWVQIGITNHKENTVAPIFDEDTDGAIFELPPTWTEYDIPGRSKAFGPLKGGGWVALNNIPPPPENQFTGEGVGETEIFDARLMFIKAVRRVMIANHMHNQAKDALEAEATRRLEMIRALALAEERERVCMQREEIRVRQSWIDNEVERTKAALEVQSQYSKDFTNLLQYIVEPPRILSRLRFMMGTNSDAGFRALCQDPSTYKLLEIFITPLLYPEDEESYKSQITNLIGKHHINLVKVIDFSVHAVRTFVSTGFTGHDSRAAITVLERYDSITVMQYMQENWSRMSNDDLRRFLRQIAHSLVGLHEEGIVHRNFHEECIACELPPNYHTQIKGGLSSVIPAPQKAKLEVKNRRITNDPVIKLGEYWFLFNSRKAGCQYSMGRADWGAKATVPPECRKGEIVTEKADVYAFGICIYKWVTGGRTIPNMKQSNIEEIRAHIPLKWKRWVHDLLRMCLQEDPTHRASSKDIYVYLSSTAGKNSY